MLFFNSISMLPFIFWWPFIRFHFLSAAIPKFYLRQTVIHRNLYLMLIQRTFSFLRYFFLEIAKKLMAIEFANWKCCSNICRILDTFSMKSLSLLQLFLLSFFCKQKEKHFYSNWVDALSSFCLKFEFINYCLCCSLSL